MTPIPQLPSSDAASDAGIIDRTCDQFERQLRMDRATRLEDFLPEQEPLRDQMLRELLSVELEVLASLGTPPDFSHYCQGFAEDRAIVAESFEELNRSVQATCASDQARQFWIALDPSELPRGLENHPRFRLLRLLGSGGMGVVYLAEHRLMQRIVALKVIRPDNLSGSAGRQRFHREIQLAAKLHHPNIVTAFDAEQHGELDLLAMEYIEGTDLGRYVSQNGPLSIGQACEFARQAALGLQHAHELGMAHRDIKPHNLMLTPAGQVKILDFGLAHLVRDEVRATQSGMLLGSVDFMAPEQATDSRSADIRSDIYALGCTLYYLLTGRAPYADRPLLGKIQSHATQSPLRPRDLPDPTWQVLEKMLAKEPIDRYQQPREVVEALHPFVQVIALAGQPASTELDPAKNVAKAPAAIQWTMWQRNPRRAFALSLLGLVLLAGALTVAQWRQTPEDVPEQALQLYERSMSLLSKRREGATQQAIVMLKEAITLAPTYVPAHVALANAYNFQADYNWEMPDHAYPLARDAAARARELDPNSVGAILTEAFTIDGYECDHAQARQLFEQALELDDQSVDGHHWFAWLLMQQGVGHIQEAEEHIRKAEELGTTHDVILTNLGTLRYYEGSFALAEEKFLDALKDSGNDKAHLDLGMTYAVLGRKADAYNQFAHAPSGLTVDGRDVLAMQAYACAAGGDPAEARRLLVELEGLAATKPVAFDIAAIYAALGDKDQAFVWLRVAFEYRSSTRSYIKVDPRLAPLRSDERFAPFVREAGFTESDSDLK